MPGGKGRRAAAECIPDAKLIEFDDVGHLSHIEVPERYLEALGGVLEQ